MSTNLRILLIEDDADDIELLEEALTDNKISYELDVIMQGDKVVPYLDKCNIFPDIIILDFNIPKLHGREILKIIKTSGTFKKIPLIVLTTSKAKEDIDYALSYGADHFITKPTTIVDFNITVNTIVNTIHKNGRA
jgi:CheY-like chemotaxis protein